MLVSLSIRDVVLIDRLDLDLTGGLSAFTGETGAGKSILLDSLGLALGARSEAGLIRPGASQLSVTVGFEPPANHRARELVAEQGLSADGTELILRRVVGADGRSKAFVNDQPVSVALLRRIGDALVEIHGQFESHDLMDQANHAGILDAHGRLTQAARDTAIAWRALADATKARTQAEADIKSARAHEDSLRADFEDLETLAPLPGEDSRLAARRALLMQGEKLAEGMNGALTALGGASGADSALRTASRALERIAGHAEGRFDPVIAALDRAAIEVAEATGQLERLSADIPLDPRALEAVEERLFALRAAARKHGIEAEGLAALRADLARRLDALSGSGDGLIKLARAEQAARAAFVQTARALSQARQQAARTLDTAIAQELPPLKLDRARFETRVTEIPEEAWGSDGMDRVEFMVATNPGLPPAPMAKIASGGELSRFMLALKVVLAGTSTIPTIVFDEVDSGIGGAVAAAVGERLGRLGETLQVLVVTHSPQVAARAKQQYRVSKTSTPEGSTATTVTPLDQRDRLEEIARMLAGEIITPEARAAARSLLSNVPHRVLK